MEKGWLCAQKGRKGRKTTRHATEKAEWKAWRGPEKLEFNLGSDQQSIALRKVVKRRHHTSPGSSLGGAGKAKKKQRVRGGEGKRIEKLFNQNAEYAWKHERPAPASGEKRKNLQGSGGEPVMKRRGKWGGKGAGHRLGRKSQLCHSQGGKKVVSKKPLPKRKKG